MLTMDFGKRPKCFVCVRTHLSLGNSENMAGTGFPSAGVARLGKPGDGPCRFPWQTSLTHQSTRYMARREGNDSPTDCSNSACGMKPNCPPMVRSLFLTGSSGSLHCVCLCWCEPSETLAQPSGLHPQQLRYQQISFTSRSLSQAWTQLFHLFLPGFFSPRPGVRSESQTTLWETLGHSSPHTDPAWTQVGAPGLCKGEDQARAPPPGGRGLNLGYFRQMQRCGALHTEFHNVVP